MFDLLAVQGILNILLQNHCSNASILRRSPSFTVQLSHVYSTNGKTIALTIRTSGSKVMTLLFNILFRFVIAFNFMAAVTVSSDFGVQKVKSVTVSIVFPSICTK